MVGCTAARVRGLNAAGDCAQVGVGAQPNAICLLALRRWGPCCTSARHALWHGCSKNENIHSDKKAVENIVKVDVITCNACSFGA